MLQVYDALERLALRSTQNMTPSGTTHYVYDREGHLLVEASDTGTTVREYAWLDDMPLAVVADVDTSTPKLWFVHADHLDRPVKMTDDTKAAVWDAIYRPFGEVHAITGTASNNLRFPGQYFLIEAGLHYNWHRHYEPTLGRYLQPDPLGLFDGPSIYAYAQSAPTAYVDPDGNLAFVPILVGLGAGIALDLVIQKIKETVCTCRSATATTGAYAATGAAYGGFGPFVQKPRTGAAGGGRSGGRTSAFSRFLFDRNPGHSGGTLRNVGRLAGPFSLLTGAGFVLFDAYQIYDCYTK